MKWLLHANDQNNPLIPLANIADQVILKSDSLIAQSVSHSFKKKFFA